MFDERKSIERRLATLYGANSKAIKALYLVREEMCKEKGFVRDDGSHYFVHCIDVANTLLLFDINKEDVICAALLHDIVEDVEGYTIKQIEKMFNKNVSHLVDLVTKERDKDYKDPEILQAYVDRISCDMEASCIKTADRMNNMMTLQDKTSEACYRTALDTEKFYLPFFKYCRDKYQRYFRLFEVALMQNEPLIYHIKSFYNEIKRLEDCGGKEQKTDKGVKEDKEE